MKFASFFQSCFPGVGDYVNSTACDYVSVDAIDGTARVMYKDRKGVQIYNYSNVSRRAIMKFIADDARSLGKFVNNVLTQSRVKVSQTF